jgi:hypothetical protein
MSGVWELHNLAKKILSLSNTKTVVQIMNCFNKGSNYHDEAECLSRVVEKEVDILQIAFES